MSRPYAEVAGDPIGHSKSPLIHGFWLAKLGIDGDYRKVRVPPAELAAYIAQRREDPDWRGCNVTIPHKRAILELVDTVDDIARVAGAANTVRNFGDHIGATSTDCDGFIEPLKPFLRPDITAAVVGAGGAARAVLAACKGSEVTVGALANRDLGKAAALLAGFGASGVRLLSLGEAMPAVDLVVNASALGMTGYPAYVPDLGALPTSAIVYDLVYAPLETPLLAAARRRGLSTIDGLAMLIGQAALAFEIFFAAAPPREHDAELRALLTR